MHVGKCSCICKWCAWVSKLVIWCCEPRIISRLKTCMKNSRGRKEKQTNAGCDNLILRTHTTRDPVQVASRPVLIMWSRFDVHPMDCTRTWKTVCDLELSSFLVSYQLGISRGSLFLPVLHGVWVHQGPGRSGPKWVQPGTPTFRRRPHIQQKIPWRQSKRCNNDWKNILEWNIFKVTWFHRPLDFIPDSE